MMATPTAPAQRTPLSPAATEAEGAEAGGDHRPGSRDREKSRRPEPLRGGGQAAAELEEFDTTARLERAGRSSPSTPSIGVCCVGMCEIILPRPQV